jgi:PPM family protein phosphatase
MTEREWLIVGGFAVVAVVAYLLGSRSRSADEKPVSRPTTPGTKPAKSSASAAAGNGRPEKSEKAEKTEKTEKAAKAEKPATAEKSAAPKSTKDADKPPMLAKLEYEEDEEIDPTRVGEGPAPARAIYQPPVKRIVYDDEAEIDEPTQSTSLFLISATAQTDTGLRRKRNEDSLLVLEDASLFVVADGMGGYRGGEMASQLAVKEIGGAFRDNNFEGEPHEGVPKQASELARAIQSANAAILETAKRNPELEGMGTTVCAARFSPTKRRVFVAHVGDSRCYRLRGGEMRQMTADHTMADHGVKGPAAAHLSRAVGIWPTVPIDIVMAVPKTDDAFLLCSDGLTKMLQDKEIAEVLRTEPHPKQAVSKLIEAANARGGKDNITVVLVRVVASAAAAPSSTR